MLYSDSFDLDSLKRQRLEKLALNHPSLEGVDTTGLLMEVNNEYAKTMNKMLFDKYLRSCSNELITHDLNLPDEEEEKEVKYFGLIETEVRKGTKEVWMYHYSEIFTAEVSFGFYKGI